jgi:hypothetical protein
VNKISTTTLKLKTMKPFKKIFFLTALVAIISASFSTETYAQSRKSDDPAMVFNTDNMDEWYVSKIPPRVRDGETVLATSRKDRTQIIAKVREGKIVQLGYKPVGKDFTPLRKNASACSPTGLCFSWQIPHCYHTPWGDCICVCGAWFTTGN